mmetsp:Transcript_12740/g.53406  ORF Transcript_12740/g.53406 Transcript_12740/m.53406 type:complete len:299 (+) Transcript_12740:1166-2062(+)
MRSPSLTTSLGLFTRVTSSSLTWHKPSIPGRTSTKAPNSRTLVTRAPRYVLPTSGSTVRLSMIATAASMSHPNPPFKTTFPSSLMSMVSILVCSQMLLICSPPLPMTRPMYFLETVIVRIWGAYLLISPPGGGSAFSISPRMWIKPTRARSSAVRITGSVMPSTLMSSWNAVRPSASPAILKSMSPSASSLPRMSVRTTGASPSASSPRIRPIAMPATFLEMGTPASCSARHPAHTDAMEDDPLLSVMVLSRRTVNGNCSSGGMMGASARSARLPCPTSRRFAAPMRPVSPTEDGGKK